MMKPIFALLMCSLAAPAFATEASPSPMDAKKQEMMKAWMEASTPGEPHKLLASLAGKWKYASKWWESADAKAQESVGTSTFKMILGGRFLQNESKGLAMGQKFEGLGYTGYDNVKGKYISSWMDNMSTGVMHGTGSFDVATQTLTDTGTFSCPLHKDRPMNYRTEWKIISKDSTVFTMWGPGLDDKEYKQMEMTFKRVK